MRLVLKQFQEEAVTKLLRHMRGAARRLAGGRPSIGLPVFDDRLRQDRDADKRRRILAPG